MIAVWFVLVAVVMAGSLAAGAAPKLSTWMMLVAISLSAPSVFLLIWRGAPPATVAELLHSVEAEQVRR
ncbi:MAG: hypothetical protein A3H97_19190 [Acidobacteria bacterium RIFCSPLOWO2_02_FULL_65_29]|nr:MAG: hypothetical protein A3H97_19190 [Acidobacteria bacterium RIFCSPLOWO2_02_FULL_65_29]